MDQVIPARTVAWSLALGLLAWGRAAPAAPFDLIATHPDAVAQSTATGRIISTLKPFHGKLYAGYGDYDPMNTGPIGIRAFDPAAGRFTGQLLARPQPPHGAETNAVMIFREIAGRLYAPHIDPWPDPPPAGELGGYSQGVVSGAGEAWTDHRVVPGIHLFDMATLDGTDLWVVGAGGSDAVAWRRRDAAGAWEASLAVRPQRAGAGFARFYAVGAYGGKLYVQAHDHGTESGLQGASRVFDGTSWTIGPSLAPASISRLWHPEVFAGHLVYQTAHAGWRTSTLYKFDGARSGQAFASAVYDYTISDGVLYALSGGGRIERTTDLTNWTLLDAAPTDARSLGVLDGRLYVGATDARLYLYSVAIPEPAAVTLLGVVCLAFGRRRRAWTRQHEDDDGRSVS